MSGVSRVSNTLIADKLGDLKIQQAGFERQLKPIMKEIKELREEVLKRGPCMGKRFVAIACLEIVNRLAAQKIRTEMNEAWLEKYTVDAEQAKLTVNPLVH